MKAYDDYLDLIDYQSGRKTKRYQPHNQDFTCVKCGAFVSTHPILAGVQNRNHCPFCLHSRHMDHYQPGDRLSACKAAMCPVGLALKSAHKKYAPQGSGELMIVHLCMDCGKLSINRTAADDDQDVLKHIFQHSWHTLKALNTSLEMAGIHPLVQDEAALVHTRLYGREDLPPIQPVYFN